MARSNQGSRHARENAFMSCGQAGRRSTSDSPAGGEASEGSIVVVLNRDLMFGSRIRNALRTLGLGAVFAADTAQFADLARSSGPALVLGVIDMNGGVDWQAVRKLKDDPTVDAPLIAFGPHVDVAGRRAAKAAGIDRLLSNGEFHRDTAGLLRRYARRIPPTV